MYTRALHLETATGSSLRVPPDWGAVAGWPLCSLGWLLVLVCRFVLLWICFPC